MDVITYALSKKIAAHALSGVQSMSINGQTLIINTKDGGVLTMAFPTPKDGISVMDIDVNANNQIVFTMSDGTEFISGEIPTLKGDAGFSPTIIENADNTDKIYKLDITTADSTFTTPNLKGADGTGGMGSGEENIIESIKVNGVVQTVAEDKSVDITVPTVDVDKNYVDKKVDGLIDDNEIGLTKTFSNDKITNTFATLKEVNNNFVQTSDIATMSKAGLVRPDGSSLGVDESGIIYILKSVLGLERLWTGSATASSFINLDRKTYTLYLFMVSGTPVLVSAPISVVGDLSFGTPVLLNNGSAWVSANRHILIDSYVDHFYVKTIGDYDFNGNVYTVDRTITDVFGLI